MMCAKTLKSKLVFLAIFLCFSQRLLADTWKVFFYIDATDDLCDMAFKNITDMMKGSPNENVDFVIQMHAYDDVALRYRVNQVGLVFLGEAKLSGNSKQDFVEASKWAFQPTLPGHPEPVEGRMASLGIANTSGAVNSSGVSCSTNNCVADHVMIIASNHGWGILDPHWDAESSKWQVGNYELSNVNSLCTIKSLRIDEFSGDDQEFVQDGQSLTRTEILSCADERSFTDEQSLTRTESLSFSQLRDNHKKCRHKGFMFSAKPRVYLNNQDLIDCLEFITKNLLGKQIDVLAFDTCMGDMFEVGYEVAPYVKYLVGNQSCSLRDGFDYVGVVGVLNQGLAPRDLVTGMVKAFDAYYSKNDKSGIYTHAAIDLGLIKDVSNALDQVIIKLLGLQKNTPEVTQEITQVIMKARDNAPRFCLWPMYTDLIAFCKKIEEGLGILQANLQLSLRSDSKQISQLSSQLHLKVSSEILAIQNALHDLYAKSQKFVVARCGGHSTFGKAHGFAIYLPPAGPIDPSYLPTVFAKESRWIDLLKLICESK